MKMITAPRCGQVIRLIAIGLLTGACAAWSPTLPNAGRQLPTAGSPASSTPSPSLSLESSPNRTASPSPAPQNLVPVEGNSATRPGGLGATVEQWEEAYGLPTRGEFGELRYAAGRFVASEVANGRVRHLQIVYGEDAAISQPDARAVARALLPTGRRVGPEAFAGGTPGDITVLYRPAVDFGRVETVVLMTGRPSWSW